MMKKLWVILIAVVLMLAVAGAYVYATSNNPTPEERKSMTKEQLRRIEPAYDGGGSEVSKNEYMVEDLMLEEIAPEDQKAVRDKLSRGEQPNLKKRNDGLFELVK